MTIARAFRASGLNNPAVPLTSESLAEWISGGRTKAGSLVSEQRVLGLPAYYRAIAIRSGVEAALPLKVYKRGTRQRIVQRTVLDSPNPAQKPFGFWQTMRMNGIAWGNSYARKEYNGADVVTKVWPMHPSRVRVVPVDITSAVPDGKLFIVVDRHGVEHRWTRREVFHVPFMSPDGMVGVSAMQAFRESLGGAIAAEDTAGSLFANGTRISGVLQSKKSLTETSATRLKSRWREVASGAGNAGDIAVLDNDTEFKPTALPPQDAELLQSRKWSVAEIARMVGVMPHMIGDTERSTSWGTGIEAQFIGWVQTIVYPELVNIEQIVTGDLLPGGWDGGSWFAEHSLEGILRGDSAARAQFYASAIQWGWMSRNEVRILENREAADGLDEFLVPSNLTLISIDGKAVPLTANPGGSDASSAA